MLTLDEHAVAERVVVERPHELSDRVERHAGELVLRVSVGFAGSGVGTQDRHRLAIDEQDDVARDLGEQAELRERLLRAQ
jgi:hypothetical protein